MNKKIFLLILTTSIVLGNHITLFGSEDNSESIKLHKIFHDEWERALKDDPFMATYVGDPRYADKVPDRSLAAIEKRRAHVHEVKKRLETISYEKLDTRDKLNFDLFSLNISQDIEGQKFHSEYMPVNQMAGLHTELTRMVRMAPKRSAKQIDALIQRLRQYPILVDQTIVLMQQGLKQGLTPPKVVLSDVANQIMAHVTDDPEQSPIFISVFNKLSSTISQADQRRLRKEGAEVIVNSIAPAFKKLHQFWVNDYFPKTRDSISLSRLPNGKAWYNYNVRIRTTTGLSADAIHKIGLGEVKRIRNEMEKIRQQTGFAGDLHAFFKFMRTDKQFFYTREQDLITGYRDIAKRIDEELPKLFGTLPRLTFGIIPVPKHEAKTQTTAYYNPGSVAAGRPGYFFANTYNLASRPKWEMEALTLHEAMPGHHLQIALAEELEDVPDFRRYGFHTAFIEGWGLYAESLGEELGMYEDPYSKFGQLTYEMWRAIRLVVDTGMHAKDWSRQQAIDFFSDNAGKTAHDIRVEIDRYIVWPGQALAYKIGELKLKELRALATQELGEGFNIREFHDRVLLSGSLPLSILEKNIKHWISAVK